MQTSSGKVVQGVKNTYKRQRKTLNNASLRSIDQLVAAIHAFTAVYNEKAAPFVWRKREVGGAQLRNTIVNLRN